MKHVLWILLFISTSPVYAQDADRVDRNTIGDEKPLSQTVKDDEERLAAFEDSRAKPPMLEDPGLPDSSPHGKPQGDRQ